MATVTVTLTANMRLQTAPRTDPRGGVTSVAFQSGSRTYGGAGDLMMLAKIPNQARMLGVNGVMTTSNNGNVLARMVLMRADSISANGTLGTLSEMSVVMGSLTTAAAAPVGLQTAIFTPAKVSLSDDAAVQFAVLALVAVSGTQSTSFSIDGVALYETSGNEI